MFNLSTMFQGLKDIRRKKIWQLFRATDFESLMYPSFTFCRILGIFPYKMNGSTIKACKPRYILSTIIFCVFCTFEIIYVYKTNISIMENRNSFTKLRNVGTPEILNLNVFEFINGFMVATTFILSGPRMRLLQTILELSSKLPPKSYQNLSRLIHTKDILGFFFIVVVALYCFLLQTTISVLHILLYIYTTSLVLQMDMLYMNCVCILKACFKQINDNLANLRKIVTRSEPYLLNGTYHEQRIPFLLREIIALKKQHLAINDAVRMLKMVFSLHLLCMILLTFIQITFYLYTYLMQIFEDMPFSNEVKKRFRESCIIGVAYYFIKMALIVWACETGKNQATEISSSVHDVFNSTSNKQIKYEMQLFSLQISHCENIFSAKGLTVDATLITEMLGGITSYLVILIQFLRTNSCDEKSVQDMT